MDAKQLFSNLHTAACRSFLTPLINNQWMVRPTRFHLGYSRTRGLQFRMQTVQWGLEEKRQYVLERLRLITRHAQRYTPYYQRVFTASGFDAQADFSFDDFARLPILEREAVIDHGQEMISDKIPRSRLRPESTGGSTGVPVHVWMDHSEAGWKQSGTDFYYRSIGLTPGMKTALLWGHHLDPVRSGKFTDRLLAFVNNVRWFESFRLSPETLAQYHHEMETWCPDFIIAYASALAAFAEYLLDRHIKPAYPSTACITGGEKLFPAQRQLVETAFRKVHEQYGSRDVGLLAFQRNSSSPALEVDWTNLLVEPETNEPESAILVTKLNACGMPMIRYRLGDIARFSSGSCPGHPTFELCEVMGRVADRIIIPGEKWNSGLQLPHLMKDHPVREFMFLQKKDYSIELQLVPTGGFCNEDLERIKKIVGQNLPGLPLRISVVRNIERTNANKLRPVRSELNLRGETKLK